MKPPPDSPAEFHRKLEAAVARQLTPEIDVRLLGDDFAKIKSFDQVVFDFLESMRPMVLAQLGLSPNVRLDDIVVWARSPSGDLSGPLDDMVLRRVKGNAVFDDDKLNLTYHLKHEDSARPRALEARLDNDPSGAHFSFGDLATYCSAELYRHMADKGETSCGKQLLDPNNRLITTYGRLYAQAVLQLVEREYAAGRLSEAGALTLKTVCRTPIGTDRLKGDDVMSGTTAFFIRARVSEQRKPRELTMPGLLVVSRATAGAAGAVTYAVGAPEPFGEYRLEDIEAALDSYRHTASTDADFLRGNDIGRALRVRLAQSFPDIDFGKENVTLSLSLEKTDTHVFHDMPRATATILIPRHRRVINLRDFQNSGMAPTARKAWLSGQTLEEGGRAVRYPALGASTIGCRVSSDEAALPLGAAGTSVGTNGGRKLRELTAMQTVSALAGHEPKGKDQWSIGDRRELIMAWAHHHPTLVASLKGAFVVAAHGASNAGTLSAQAKSMVLLSVGGETATDRIELSGLRDDSSPLHEVEVGWLGNGVFQSTIMTIRRAGDSRGLTVSYDALDPATKFREFKGEAELIDWYRRAYDDVSRRSALAQRFYGVAAELVDGVPMSSRVRGERLGAVNAIVPASGYEAGPFAQLWGRARLLMLAQFDDWPYKAWDRDRDTTIMTVLGGTSQMKRQVSRHLGDLAAVQTALFDRTALNSRRHVREAYGGIPQI